MCEDSHHHARTRAHKCILIHKQASMRYTSRINTFTCMQACKHTSMHANMLAYMHTGNPTYLPTYIMHPYKQAHNNTTMHTYTFTHTALLTHMHTCLHAYIIHAHMRTRIHVYMRREREREREERERDVHKRKQLHACMHKCTGHIPPVLSLPWANKLLTPDRQERPQPQAQAQ